MMHKHVISVTEEEAFVLVPVLLSKIEELQQQNQKEKDASLKKTLGLLEGFCQKIVTGQPMKKTPCISFVDDQGNPIF